MAYALITSSKGVATTNAVDTSGADLIVLCGAGNDQGIAFGVSDSKGNTWTGLSIAGSGNTTAARIHYCRSPTVGASHTFSIAQSYDAIFMAAFSGSAASPFDQQAIFNHASLTGIQAGTVTPTEDNELLVTGLCTGGNATSPSITAGFTIAQGLAAVTSVSYGGAIAYLIQTTAASVSPTWNWTNSVPCAACNATFKMGAGAPPSTYRGARYRMPGVAIFGGA